MNRNRDALTNKHELEQNLDRLVDGELSAEEYRALLAGLEDEPEGWRRCALAFLEAQALENELGGLRRTLEWNTESTIAPQSETKKPADDENRVKQRRLDPWAMLAIAASFFIAFGLGSMAPWMLGAGKIAKDRSVAGNNNHQASPEITPARHEALRPVGDVRLVMDGPGGEMTEAGQVPLYEAEAGFDPFWRQERPALGPELIELLRQSGHDVVRQEHYLPGQLDDGRQIIVPMEQYRITPVSRKAY